MARISKAEATNIERAGSDPLHGEAMNGSDMLRKSVEMLRGDKLRRKFEGRR